MTSVHEYYCSPALYDLIYSDFTADLPLWVAAAKAAPGPVLELCCGNGRVLVPSRAAGADIEGLDLAPAMLEACRAKLAAHGLEAPLTPGDMRDFTRPRRFALVTIPFNAFLHNLNQADQIATLSRCRAHLAPGGRLMLHVFQPDLEVLLENDGTPRFRKENPTPDGGRLRVTDTGRFDPVAQRIAIERRVERLDAAGRPAETHDLGLEIRYVWKPEMELLLAAAGFGAIEVQGGFEAPRAPRAGDNLVWTAWAT
jgi:SAM-dependent methyltransferase